MSKSVKHSENLVKTEYTNYREDLYRQAARDLQANGSDITRYVISIFGPDLMGSLALAIDPYKQFHNTPNKVALLSEGAPVVRTRTKCTILASERKEYVNKRSIAYSYANNPQGPLFSYIYTGPTHSNVASVKTRPNQPQVFATFRDTTYRTRPKDKTQGEFEMFIPKYYSRPRSHHYLNSENLVYNSIGTGQRTKTQTYFESRCTGPEFRSTDADVQLLLPLARARGLNYMAKNVYGMLDKVQPSHRTYDLVYQIAELRDLSQTLRGTLQVWLYFERLVGTNFFRTLQRVAGSWRDPQLMRAYASQLGSRTGFQYDELKTLDQNAASAFLTFKFGWESMVRGIVEYLPSPARVAREVNHLIDSIGKDRSYRTKKKWITEATSFPEFTVALLEGETIDGTSTVKREGHRKIELRLMANFHISFPKLEIPRLRKELALRKMGAYPSVSDIYNLIPWTWLGDWFTGAGDYVQLMDTIANDKSTINYGFITYREEGETTASVRGKFLTQISSTINGVNSSYNIEESLVHEGKFKYTYQLRRSISSLTNVRQYWDPNLGPSQLAILGALFSAKSGSVGRREAS